MSYTNKSRQENKAPKRDKRKKGTANFKDQSTLDLKQCYKQLENDLRKRMSTAWANKNSVLALSL